MRIDLKNISAIAFCAFAIKLLILQDLSAFSAVPLLISGALLAFYEYKATNGQLNDMKEQVTALNKRLDEMFETQTRMQSNISSVKVAQNMKSGLGR